MTPPSQSNAMPATESSGSVLTATMKTDRRFSRGQVSFWLWAVAAPLGSVLIATLSRLTI